MSKAVCQADVAYQAYSRITLVSALGDRLAGISDCQSVVATATAGPVMADATCSSVTDCVRCGIIDMRQRRNRRRLEKLSTASSLASGTRYWSLAAGLHLN